MWFGVLGPLEVRDAVGDPVRIAGPARRQVLAALLCRAGRAVSAQVLIEDLWGECPPRSAAKTLQSHIVRLRDDLGSDARSLLITDPSGYRLAVANDQLDTALFERAVKVVLDADTITDVEGAIEQLDIALSIWRGEAYQEFTEGAFAIAERVRLTELRSAARELRTDLALRTDRTSALVPELERRVREEPYRERGWQQLAIALYRSGRQTDALAALRRVSALLAEDVGVDPGPELRELQTRILRHDETLARSGAAVRNAATRMSPAKGSIACPYRGLAGYREGDAGIFVGRERLSSTIAGALGERAAVVITGASGSGKSSLVWAGLLPALRRGALPGSASWRIEERTPSSWRQLAQTPDLLVVDQAEELFSILTDEERAEVIDALTNQVDRGGRLLLVVRGDFFGRLTEVPPLDRWAQQSAVLVGRCAMTKSDARSSSRRGAAN
jgi:DNA-binding SARP family transcriptional activator